MGCDDCTGNLKTQPEDTKPKTLSRGTKLFISLLRYLLKHCKIRLISLYAIFTIIVEEKKNCFKIIVILVFFNVTEKYINVPK